MPRIIIGRPDYFKTERQFRSTFGPIANVPSAEQTNRQPFSGGSGWRFDM